MRKKIILYGLFLGIIQWTTLPVLAQGDSAAIRGFLAKIQQAYGKGHFLDFSMRYYYANADNPQRYLDSLEGRIQMNKEQCRLSLDGVETVITGKYAIQINSRDKFMYLAAAPRAASTNPLGMVDTILAHIQGVHTALSKSGHTESLTLDFPPDQAYTHILIQIDDKTGYLQRISYALNTARLVGKELLDQPGKPSPYKSRGNMEIVFSDYRQGNFDNNLFRDDNFVTRVAPGYFEPAARYKDYHIYLASSNL